MFQLLSSLTFHYSYLREFLHSQLWNRPWTAVNDFKPAFVVMLLFLFIRLGSIWSTSVDFYSNAKIKRFCQQRWMFRNKRHFNTSLIFTFMILFSVLPFLFSLSPGDYHYSQLIFPNIKSPQKLNQWITNHCSLEKWVRFLWDSGHNTLFNSLIHYLVSCVFLFKDPLFNTRCWFIMLSSPLAAL